MTDRGQGSVAVTAHNIDILGQSKISAGIQQGMVASGSQPGDIDLNATGAVTIKQASSVSNQVEPFTTGNAGNINIKAGEILIINQANHPPDKSLSAALITEPESIDRDDNSTGKGRAGNISLESTGSISLIGQSISSDDKLISTFARYGSLGSGNISLKAKGSIFLNDAYVVSSDFSGKAIGNISLQGDQAISMVNNSSVVSTNYSVGNSGNIILQSNGPISLRNSMISTRIGSTDSKFPSVKGNAGDVYINGQSLSITDGALVESNSDNSGSSGNINIVAKDFVELSGTGPFPSFFPDKPYSTYRLDNRIYSSLTTSSEQNAQGPGGTISITTNKLRLSDGANIRADSKSSFRGGDIIINAHSIELTGGGQIFTTASSTGSAGNITLNVTDRIAISGNNPGFYNARQQVIQAELDFGRSPDQNRSDADSISAAESEIGTISPNSGIFANSSGSGKAGNIQATANLIQLDQGTISSDTRGGEGNINLHSNNLVLDRGSSITTNASGSNVTGGNIKIDTDALAAVQGSLISASSKDFRGGQITINLAPLGGIFLSSDSKITATGVNSQSNGIVKISTPDTDPSRALTILPTVTEETPKLVSSSCAAFNEAAGGNNFIITGRGGLPPSPSDPLNSDVVWTDTRLPVTITQQQQPKKDTAQKSSHPKPIAIVPATGWVLNSKGEIVLISSATNANLRTPISCPSQ